MRNGMFSGKWMVDIDESILEFMPAFLEFYNNRHYDRHQRRFGVKDMFDYDMEKVFGIPKRECVDNILDFYQTHECHHLEALEGAQELLTLLKDPLAITARPSAVRKMTEYNLSHRFEAFAPKLLFAKPYNSFLGNSPEGIHTKTELCTMHGIKYALEDSFSQANALTEAGVKVFLVNQPWNAQAQVHPDVTRINSVMEILN